MPLPENIVEQPLHPIGLAGVALIEAATVTGLDEFMLKLLILLPATCAVKLYIGGTLLKLKVLVTGSHAAPEASARAVIKVCLPDRSVTERAA